MWQGLHVPWGHPAGDSQILNSADELGVSRAPTCAQGCQVLSVPGPLCPPGCPGPLCPQGAQVRSVPQGSQHCCCPCCRKCVWGSDTSKQSCVPALIRPSLEPGGLSTGEAWREGHWPCPGPAVQAGDRQTAREAWVAAGGLSPCGSLVPPPIWLFPHSLFIYLQLSACAAAAARLPPAPEKCALASPWMGRAGVGAPRTGGGGCPWPQGPALQPLLGSARPQRPRGGWWLVGSAC